MSQKIYLRLNNDTCKFDENTNMWRIELPRDFTNSRNTNKRINVINFMFSAILDPPTANVKINIEFTTFHSPTLCDGNFNQDNYICTLCYTQNTFHKSYQIKSNPQYIEFYFKNSNNEIIQGYWYEGFDESNRHYEFTEKFNVDLELIC